MSSHPPAQPFWSVMIPNYHCAHYLAKTLASLIAENVEPGDMQIEVVDNHSTKDDPRAVVDSIGQGRVNFFQQPTNIGMTNNFNACIERARGRWVHILHSDDYVLPGFYAALRTLIERHPQVALACTRAYIVDDNGQVRKEGPRLDWLTEPTNDLGDAVYANPFLFPTIVVAKSAYEKLGGYSAKLSHCIDWEMWTRLIQNGGGVATNEILACYRLSAGNDTSTQARTAENQRDQLRFGEILRQRTPGFDMSRFVENVRYDTYLQYQSFLASGDRAAAQANLQLWRQLSSPTQRLRKSLSELRDKVFARNALS